MSSLITLLLTLVAAFQVPTPAAPAPPTSGAQAAVSYQVGASDVLAIKVFDEPTLTGVYNVDSDGAISFPYVGRVIVGGKTVRDIEGILTKLLSPDYVKKPQVSVEVSQFARRASIPSRVR
jgi:polysaccharide export outer membrane protein